MHVAIVVASVGEQRLAGLVEVVLKEVHSVVVVAGGNHQDQSHSAAGVRTTAFEVVHSLIELVEAVVAPVVAVA